MFSVEVVTLIPPFSSVANSRIRWGGGVKGGGGKGRQGSYFDLVAF